MDITTQLTSDYYEDHRSDPSVPTDNLTTKLGWDRTEGKTVSQDIATDIRDVVETRTKKVSQFPTFEKVSQQTKNSDHQVQFLRHSQVRLGHLIAEGGFNQIFDIRSLSSDDEGETDPAEKKNKYVVKVLQQDLAENEIRFALCASDIVKEALLMSALDHKNILKIKAVSEGGIAGFEHGRRTDAFFMVVGKLEGSLQDRLPLWREHFREIQSRPRDRAVFFQERLQIVADIADALSYIHGLNMIHRDLKPLNIGFDSDGTVKVFDFGLARMIPESKHPDEAFQLTQKSGTYRYISPENFKGQPYNLKSDVYSFAILMHQILSFKAPFSGMSTFEQEKAVFENGIRPRIPLFWPWSIRKQMKRGWAQKSSKRPTMQVMVTALQKQLG
jgi:serine/threonine protein kinase